MRSNQKRGAVNEHMARQLVMRGMDKRHVGSDKTRFSDLARDVRGEDNLDGPRRA